MKTLINYQDYTFVPLEILHNRNLSNRAKTIYMIILSHEQDGKGMPEDIVLEYEAGVGERTFYRAIKELKENKIIE